MRVGRVIGNEHLFVRPNLERFGIDHVGVVA